jgi:hypothetical protein
VGWEESPIADDDTKSNTLHNFSVEFS